jgi:branched-chain amino acid transport system ATP-binding protein
VSEVFNIMQDLKKDGLTILLSEQNARKALQCSDRAYVFEAGSLMCEGTAEELMQDTRVHTAYLGDVI